MNKSGGEVYHPTVAQLAALERRVRTVEAHLLALGRCACGGLAPVYKTHRGVCGKIQYRKCLTCSDTFKTIVPVAEEVG